MMSPNQPNTPPRLMELAAEALGFQAEARSVKMVDESSGMATFAVP